MPPSQGKRRASRAYEIGVPIALGLIVVLILVLVVIIAVVFLRSAFPAG